MRLSKGGPHYGNAPRSRTCCAASRNAVIARRIGRGPKLMRFTPSYAMRAIGGAAAKASKFRGAGMAFTRRAIVASSFGPST